MGEQGSGRITDMIAAKRAAGVDISARGAQFADSSDAVLADAVRARESMRHSMSMEMRRADSLQQEVAQLREALTAAQGQAAQAEARCQQLLGACDESARKCAALESTIATERASGGASGPALAQLRAELTAAQNMYQAELVARQEAERRITAMAAELKRPAPVTSVPVIPKPPEYKLTVTSRDGNDRIREIRLQPVETGK